MNSDLKVIKGVNIAAMVLSGLGLLAALITAIVAIVGQGYLYSPEFQDLLHSSYQQDFQAGDSGITEEDAVNITTLVTSMTAVFFIFFSILGIVIKGVLIAASYFGFKTASDPSRAKSSFVWAIVAAVVAGLCGSFVSMVLFIVSAVYLNKFRRGGQAPAFTGNAAPYYSVPYQQVPYQPQAANQPVYAQPGVQQPVPPQAAPAQPVYTPAQPVPPATQPAPVAPVAEAPVQPASSAQPVQAAPVAVAPAQPTQAEPVATPEQPAATAQPAPAGEASQDTQATSAEASSASAEEKSDK